jgi:hypothetical protein
MNDLMPPKLDPDTETKRLNLVAPSSWVRKIDEWRRQQPDLPNISEAIRRLVDAGLRPNAFCLQTKKAAEITAWAKKNGLTQADAIAELIELGLKAKK